MEYIAAALEARGHDVTIADLRFSRPVETLLSRLRPGLVGSAGMHALETADVAGAGGGASVYWTTGETGTLQLDEVPRPARHQVAPWAISTRASHIGRRR